MFFEKKPTKLEKFLNVSTFKTQEHRDRDFKEMEIEQKKLVKREKKRKKQSEEPNKQSEEPKKQINTVPTILFNIHGESVIIERDLTDEENWLIGMWERGNFQTEKPHGKYLGVGQPETEINTYNNYNEIEIEVVPEGTTGKKWKQINKGKK